MTPSQGEVLVHDTSRLLSDELLLTVAGEEAHVAAAEAVAATHPRRRRRAGSIRGKCMLLAGIATPAAAASAVAQAAPGMFTPGAHL